VVGAVLGVAQGRYGDAPCGACAVTGLQAACAARRRRRGAYGGAARRRLIPIRTIRQAWTYIGIRKQADFTLFEIIALESRNSWVGHT